MDVKQYNTLLSSLDDNIYGQKFSVLIVSDSGFNAVAKKAGYKKVTKISVSIRKVSYLDIVNDSSGAEKLGVTFNPKRDSYYESEKLLGLFSHLISKPDEKYMQFKWNDEDGGNVVKSVYVDATLKIVAEEKTDTMVKSLYTPSAYKSLTEGYGRTKVMRDNDIHVYHNTPKIENIAKIKIGGIELTDKNLINYTNII